MLRNKSQTQHLNTPINFDKWKSFGIVNVDTNLKKKL